MRVRGLLLALAAAGALACTGCRGGGPDVPLPPATPFAPEVATEVHAIRDLAAQARELKAADKITEGTITRDQLRSYYNEVDAQSRESDDNNDLAVWNTAFRLMQMIEPGQDALQEYTSDKAADVVGLYSLDDKELVLVGDGGAPLSLDDDLTLAHEYVHSFQDASFDIDHLRDLERKENDDKLNTEYSTTVDALMEGDAQTASIDYLGLKMGREAYSQWLQGSGGKAVGSESALDRYSLFPYVEGLQFVLYLWERGGWEQVNEAYADPPTTTEQILHPDRYLAHDEPLGLKLPDLSDKLGDGWKQIDDSVFGEFDVYNYIMTATDDEQGARRTADGWAGGRMATYADQRYTDRVLLHLVLSWDNADEAKEFYSFFQLHVKLMGDPQHVAIDWASGDLQTQRILWDGEDEHIYGWLDGQTFHAIFAVQQSDLEQAMSTLAPGVSRDTMSAGFESQ